MFGETTTCRVAADWSGLLRHTSRRSVWNVEQLVLLGGLLIAVGGCKDLSSPGLPAGTPDPSYYSNFDGAIGLRNAALYSVDLAIPTYISDAGLLTDELQDKNAHASAGTLLQNGGVVIDPLDERILPEGSSGGGSSYAALQAIRASTTLALRSLVAYDTAAAAQATQHIMRGELYALQGYAEILLADFFCNGVPLSTIDFQQDFTYAPSSTWQQVYQDASIKLDSALTLASGGDSVINLARVLKGRAQLALGQYAAAADDVALVPDAFQYRMTFLRSQGGANFVAGSIADSEGMHGLPYRSSGDPRSATVVTCIPPNTYSCPVDTVTAPAKYIDSLGSENTSPYTTFVVADWIEARLIRAEYELQPASAPHGDWLGTLNALRATIGLPALSDPGSDAGRVALLFQERAYWLFLTGHRQGDLRRLLRQYGQYTPFRSQQLVYPSGTYTAPGTGRYGDYITAPIPMTEYNNPQYHGCLDRNP